MYSTLWNAKATAVVLALGMAALGAPGANADDALLRSKLEPSPDRGTIELPAANGHTDTLRRIELERGKSAVLHTAFAVKRVAVGDPEIADVVVLNTREIHLVAKTIGDTNVIVWNRDGGLEAAIDLHVGRPHSQIENELRRVLENKSISADGAGESVVLKGTVANPAEMERALEVANAFFPKKDDAEPNRVINLLEVGGNQQVMLEVVIAEMSRSVRRNLATNFSGIEKNGTQIFSLAQTLARGDGASLASLGSSANLVGSLVRGGDSLNVFVEAIQEDGLAQILAEPNLVARSGEAAQFLVGGEIPIPVPQAGAFGVITIVFKQFGVGVTFTPTVMSEDRIHLQVTSEVSEPDLTLTTQLAGITIPAFTTRRASTGVELGDGQTFAMAGLISDDVKELAHQIPGLGDIPILGALFRSTSFQKKETELVMLVTPRLVKPQPAGSFSLPTDHFVEPSAFEFFLLGSLEGGVMGREYEHLADLSGSTDGDLVSATDATEESLSNVLDNDFASPATAAGGFAGDVGHRIDVWDAQEDLW